MKKKLKQKAPTDNIADKLVDVKDFPIEVKVVLYGKPGTGKTTLACSFPKPLILIDMSEKGTDSVRNIKGIKVLRPETWQDIEDLYWAIKKKKIECATLVIDTMSNAQELAIMKVLEDAKKTIKESEIGNWGTMKKQQWGQVSQKLKELIFNVRDLPINIVINAHDKAFNFEDDEDITDDDMKLDPSVGPRVMPSVASVLNAAVGTIGNTFIRQVEKKIKVKGKTKPDIQKKIQYCLRIGPDPLYTTKIRKPKHIPLPSVLVDPEYDDIIELIKGEE